MYNKNENNPVKRFVEKRAYFRKYDTLCIFSLVMYSILMEMLFRRGVPAQYRNIQARTVAMWMLVNILLSRYIGYDLSICPMCNNLIPTVKQKNSDYMVPGNGELPDRCPYCNTNFYKYK